MTAFAIVVVVLIAVIAASAAFSILATRRIERAVPPQGRFLDLDGQRLHYLDEGSGPPLVLIHGLSGQMGNFTHSLVARLKSDFRVIAFDRPGSGYSTRATRGPAGVRAQAATLAKAAQTLGAVPAVVVGHSLGGAIALAFALDAPESTRAVVLLSPLTHPMLKAPAAFRSLAIRSALLRRGVASTLATPFGLAGRNWAARQVFAPEPAPADFATLGGGLLALRPANVFAASTDMVAANDDLDDMIRLYPTIRVPVGVLFGHDDPILDWHKQGETLTKEIPGVELKVVPGGHMLPITAPDVVADFIRRIAAKAGGEANRSLTAAGKLV